MSFDLGVSEFNQLIYNPETRDLSKLTRQEKITRFSSQLFEAAKYAFFEGSEFDKIQILIKFSDFKKLEEHRLYSLRLGYNLNPPKIPARVRFGNDTFFARVSLKGDLNSHFSTKKRMSLWVEIKDGYIRGFNKFALTKVRNRQFPHDHVFQNLQDKHTIGIEHFFLNVLVNGENWGIMNAEPSLTPQYLEKKGIKSPFAVRLGSDQEWLFGNNSEFFSSDKNYVMSILGPDKKLLRKKYNRVIYSRVQATLHNIHIEKLNYQKTLDAFFQILIWGNHHSINPGNVKYTFNKYNNKFEPILGDQDELTELKNRQGLSKLITDFCDNASAHVRHVLCSKKHRRSDLVKAFDRVLVNPRNVAELFDDYYDLFPIDNFRFDASVYDENRKLVSNEIDFIASQLSKYKKPNKKKIYEGFSSTNSHKNFKKISAFHFDDGKIYIKNLTSKKITIKKITSNDYEELLNISLSEFRYNKGFEKHISTPFLGIEDDLKIHFEYDGDFFKESIFPTILSDSYFAGQNFKPFGKCSDVSNYDDDLKDTCVIDKDMLIDGNFYIDKPLLIKAGVRIHFDKEMSLITANRVEILGKRENPVKFIGNSNTGGIFFNLENSGKSKFEYVEFVDLGKSYLNKLGLTGAVNIFDGNVFMNHVSFVNAQIEDAINFNYSNVDLNNISISGTLSDGIDCDFCEGKIIGMEARNIGGDAIDFSGSRILLKNGFISSVYDKGISVGEQSSIEIERFVIKDASFGIVVKDSSYLKSTETKFIKNEYFDLMSYQKKPFFSKSSVSLDAVKNGPSPKAICQFGEYMKVNNKLVTCSEINVDGLYKNTNMKKSNAN